MDVLSWIKISEGELDCDVKSIKELDCESVLKLI